MAVATGIIARYVGTRFLTTVVALFGALSVLVVLVDYIEMTRRTDQIPAATAGLIAKISLFRVPQIMEQILPFCVLVAALSCYLGLSRRLELVVARAAGMSAWQFVAPAVAVALMMGIAVTTVYNPISTILQERSKRLEAELSGVTGNLQGPFGIFWMRQKTDTGQSIIHAFTSRNQGVNLGGVRILLFDGGGHFRQRIEARTATLEPGRWRLTEARLYSIGVPPEYQQTYYLNTNLTREQVRENFATPDTVSFWHLPAFIRSAENVGLTGAGYRYQFHKLIALPFLLAAMVCLAASVSLRLFRFGGVQKMVLSGIGAGFLLYVLSKVTRDLSTAELMHPAAAAWLPVLIGGLTGLVVLLHLEDG